MMDDAELERAAREAGLERYLEHDRESLARAFQAARGYQSRRLVVAPLGGEPSHVFRAREDGES